ncbi:MAG: ABC transporter permease [Anaerolineales bacterium]|jgi:osmoprotectant transport system permease protein
MLADMVAYLIERSNEFTIALGQHLYLTMVALAISVVLGLALGIVSSRFSWLRTLVMAIGNLGRTIPSLAVLALALPLLGIGTPPTLLALVFIGTLPVMINTSVGIGQVDHNVVEASRGMGMNDLQVLLRVELPIAAAVIMAGVRTSAVVVVASATLAAFIGGGGLGDLILRGHALNRDYIMLAGALPATLLALYFEETFGRLERWATPEGLMPPEERRGGARLYALLAAMTVMPLTFGSFLPWDRFADASGNPVVLTGLHAAYRGVGLPVMIFGLIAALWPRYESETGPSSGQVISGLAGLASFVWMTVGYFWIQSRLPANHQLGYGMYVQWAATAFIALLAIVEFRSAVRSDASSAAPGAQPAGSMT